MTIQNDIRVRRQQRSHYLPLYTDPFAMHNSDRQNISTQAFGDKLKDGVSCLLRSKLVQVKGSVYRIFDRLIIFGGHNPPFVFEATEQNHDTVRLSLEQASGPLAETGRFQ